MLQTTHVTDAVSKGVAREVFFDELKVDMGLGETQHQQKGEAGVPQEEITSKSGPRAGRNPKLSNILTQLERNTKNIRMKLSLQR